MSETTHQGGPPTTFSMPVYAGWVPQCIRPWIYVLMAFCFQFSNDMYLGAMNNIIGERGIMREDVLMCLYATLTGMAFYFPLLFRMKFRFSNKLLLMSAASVILVCNLLTMLPYPCPSRGHCAWCVAWLKFRGPLSVCRPYSYG